MGKLLLLFFLIIFSAGTAAGQSVPGPVLLQLEAGGKGYQRGLHHGTIYKEQIRQLMERWKANIKQTLRADPDSILKKFLQQTDFMPAIRKYTPDLLQEVYGIAAGSGQSFEDTYAFQLPDEFWVFIDAMGKDTSLHHCSGIGIPGTKNSPAMISQNLDIDKWMDGFQLLMHIPKSRYGPEQYILTCPGMIGFNGMNEKGIGICVNTIMSLRAGKTGLPVSFMVRALLSKTNEKQVISFLLETPHASGQNYLIGIQDSVYDFEASAAVVKRLLPVDSSGFLIHTNHSLTNEDIKPWYRKYFKAFREGRTLHFNSEARFNSMLKRVSEARKKDMNLIREILRSKDDSKNPVCNAPLPQNGFFTFGSVIMTLSGTPSLQVTAGPPDLSPYQVYYFGKKKTIQTTPG